MFQWRWYSTGFIVRLRKQHKDIRVFRFIGGVWDSQVEREGKRELHVGI